MPLMRTDAQWAAALRAMEEAESPRAGAPGPSNAYIDMATALAEVSANEDISILQPKEEKELIEESTPQ